MPIFDRIDRIIRIFNINLVRHEEFLMPIFDRIDRIIRIFNINLVNPVNPVGDFSFTQVSPVG
jgi:hypothetical protein